MKNQCGKMVKIENAYENWQCGDWIWKVLKKYQNPEQEAKNPYARWMCAVQSPYTYGGWDYGDVYVNEIKNVGAIKVA